MKTNTKPRLSRNKWILILMGIPVIAGAWWVFRPEKLFINQR
jgi:cbb3-type cytochrome oxidase subunit 3